jgi:outer membrane protein
MKRRFVLLFALMVTNVGLGLCGNWAFAESRRIGVMDTQKIIRESAIAREARGMFILDVEAKRGVLRAKEEDIRAMETELEAKAHSLSPETLEENRKDIERAVKDLLGLRDDMEEALQRKEAELREKLVLQIRQVVKRFLEKKKYAAIFESTTVFAWDDAVDVTDQIITMYDAQIGPQ